MRLNVNYNGQRIGQILEKNGIHYFEYDIFFVQNPLPLSPLLLPVERGVTVHDNATFAGLPGLIYDSLPDGFGLSVIREHFREKGIKQASPLQILSYLGERTMGALTYSPPDGDREQQQSIDLVNAALSARKLVELNHGPELDPALIQAGGTAGGVQPKILASISKDGQIITGADQVPAGMSPWIIKLNIDGKDASAYTPLEYAYFLMAKDCGITVPETSLLTDQNGVKHFAIRRFDRAEEDPNQRIHTHSYAAIAGVDYQSLSGSYEHLLQTTFELTRSYKALKQQLLRCIFNVLTHNHDDHAKNFAFQMDATGTWGLSPAYDLTMAANHMKGNWLSLNGRRRGISANDFYALIDDYRIAHSDVDQMIANVKSVASSWERYAVASGVSQPLQKEVSRHLSDSLESF
ncbi:MAG: type II toxin-antitoxin system HipA family toxin [Opitutaceae bacterium]